MSNDSEGEFCYVCEQSEPDPLRLIECTQCGKKSHFRCKKLFGNVIAKVRNKPYYCSVDCREMSTKSNKQEATNDDIIRELKSLGLSVKEVQQESAKFRAMFEQTQVQMSELITTSKQIERSQEFLAGQFDSLQVDFQAFKEEVGYVKAESSKLRKELDIWKNTCGVLVDTVDQLEVDLDRINRASISKNAVIIGLPMVEAENTLELLSRFCEVLNCSFTSAPAIVEAKRLTGKRTSNGVAPILITFSCERDKEELFQRKRSYGVLPASKICDAFSGSKRAVTVRDEMTVYGRELLRIAKDLQEELKIKYVWPGRGGKVLLKRYDGGKVEQISSKQQLHQLAPTNHKRTLKSPGSSPISGPLPKR